MDARDTEIRTRAFKLLRAAHFPKLARSTVIEYQRIADRIHNRRVRAGASWTGIGTMAVSDNYASNIRAAWCRRTHYEVALALDGLLNRNTPEAEVIARLHYWVPEAEQHRPYPCHVPLGGNGATRKAIGRSKRIGIHELPDDWLDRIWSAAVDRDYKHLSALAVTLVTGCRPSEVCERPCVVRNVGGALEVIVISSKVTDTNGQPWRKLTVSMEGHAAEHLAAMVAAHPDGLVRVQASCSAAAFSMSIADLGSTCDLPRRVCAYDVRHQRAADARNSLFDQDHLAAWLGHSALTTLRHYGRQPRGTGSRGPTPVAATAARQIRHRSPPAKPETILCQ